MAETEVKSALETNISAADILHKACIPAMNEGGRLFEIGEKFVPQMLISARAMQSTVSILKLFLVNANVKVLGTVVMGTVADDLYDIGKSLVDMMFEGAGFEIIDLGTDISAQQFVGVVRNDKPDVLDISALSPQGW